MTGQREVVITGMGVASPIGVGNEPFWASLCEGRSGVRSLGLFSNSDLPVDIGGQVQELHPERHVRPRKALKSGEHRVEISVKDRAGNEQTFLRILHIVK